MKKIKLTKNSYTIVDDDCFEELNAIKWYLGSTGYAMTSFFRSVAFKKRKVLGMHRLVTNCPSDLEVDHINRDKLDNRKGNLRVVNRTENNFNLGIRSDNKSGHTGVSWNNKANKWVSHININKKKVSLGYFDNIKDAINIYEKTKKDIMSNMQNRGNS